jgi:hypothetical protein
MESPAVVRLALVCFAKRNFFRARLWAAVVLVAAGALFGPSAFAQTGNESVPLIVIDDVPLVDAVKNLARQVGGNYILDPRIGGMAAKNVSVRFENVSARDALNSVLRDNKLTLMTNPVTTVDRIAPASLGIKPVAASQVGTTAGTVIPLMVIDDLPLTEVIAKLATSAGLKVALDPQWAGPLDKARTTVSFRWERLTARQALAALLDNYDLLLVEDAATSSARIVVKMQRGTGPSGKSEPGQKKP